MRQQRRKILSSKKSNLKLNDKFIFYYQEIIPKDILLLSIIRDVRVGVVKMGVRKLQIKVIRKKKMRLQNF